MCKEKRTYGIELEGYTNEDIKDNCLSGWEFVDDGSLNEDSGECGYCDGSGYSEERCDYCDSDGDIRCNECNDGHVDCPECDGSGTIDCEHCNGDGGYWEDDDNWVDCLHCLGDGQVECEDCNGEGTMDCEECDGRGYNTCHHCDGNVYIREDCEECDGRGHYGDGSQYSVECVSDICNEGDFEPINDVFDYIENRDWDANGSECGTHVHIGASDLEIQDLSKLAILCNIVEPMIYGTLPMQRLTGSYSKRTNKIMVGMLVEQGESITKQELANWYYGRTVHLGNGFSKYDHARYHGLNLHSYFYRGTIEFRYFKGCEDREQAKAWIDLCIKLVDFAKHATFEQLQVIGIEFYTVSTLQELIAKVENLLGLEYNFRAENNTSYERAKENVANNLRNYRMIRRAV